MANAPKSLINEAENKAADWQIAKAAAERGFPPDKWRPDHPCEFGVFSYRGGFLVAPLFPHVLADPALRCLYRTDTQGPN